VLTVDSGFVDRPEKLELLPGVAEAMALLHRRGIRCVVTTNQSIVARGLCTMAMLEAIHDRLRAMIAAGGGKIDAIYACPHHPETHHGEGVPELRRACRCRKPAPGLLFRACRELGLNLAACIMVGDRASDVRAGRAAGIRTALVGEPGYRKKVLKETAPDGEFDSLLAFAQAANENGIIRQ
jgi:histidinol-phosphate phosphatase family protein